MDLVYDLLQKIKMKSGMYLAERNIHYLYYFIHGYMLNFYDNDLWYKCCLDGFNEFVRAYYNAPLYTWSWARIILNYTNSPEEAFDRFYELFGSYMSQKEV